MLARLPVQDSGSARSAQPSCMHSSAASASSGRSCVPSSLAKAEDSIASTTTADLPRKQALPSRPVPAAWARLLSSALRALKSRRKLFSRVCRCIIGAGVLPAGHITMMPTNCMH